MADPSNPTSKATPILNRHRLLSGLTLGILVSASIIAAAACGSDNDGISAPPGQIPGITIPCTNGATQGCHITLDNNNGVLTCYDGVQSCENGQWSACATGEVAYRPAPGGQEAALPGESAENNLEPQNHILPQNCVNNPCDPSCQVFDEDPDGGITPEPDGSIYNWQQGNLDDYPPGLVNKGLQEPCDEGFDCQFDHYCFDPVGGSCPHNQCETGSGLDSECNPCVSDICATNPGCCSFSFSGSCGHSPCVTGSKLSKNCDSCVTQICNAIPTCCSSSWTNACKNAVSSICGKSCTTGTWTQTCVDKVNTTCGAFCQKDPGCAHDKCYEGGPLSSNCDPCVAQINAADPYCGTTAWDSQCVDEVLSICKKNCTPQGICVPWLPGQENPNCPGLDLTAGIPCGQSIPVCNHGNTTAPAGIRIIHFPANSNQYPKCAPDQSHPQMYECFTQAPIPPGECISVTGCPQLVGNREIMVNPPGNAYQAECSCANNWSLYSGESCGPPVCVGAKSQASIKKVNLFVSVDKSGSMQTNGWTEAMNAFKSFFGAQSSAGMGIAMRFWPDNQPVAGCDGNCSVSACASPLVPLGTLTTSSAPLDAQEQALINAINSKSPGGNTPMYPALAGATQWASTNQQANPNEIFSVVFVTDGDPTQCNLNVNTIAALASSAYNTYGVLTYVIGIEGASVSTVNQIAAAGGTGQAFLVKKGVNNSQVEADLLAALNAIRGNAVSCDLELNGGGIFDANDVTVLYTPGGSNSPTGLPQVANSQSCGSGWYFDNPVNPTKVTLCPSTCMQIQSDLAAKVEVSIGCPPIYTPVTYTEVYTGQCPQGTKLQWGFFAYSTATPGDSNVVFDAQVSSDGISFSPSVNLAIAKASPNTQVCPMGGPAPCPVNVFNKLGGIPNAQKEFLKLSTTLNPATGGASAPTINNWEITYSCPASE